ncbi:ABC transporter ATP-binding protein [Brevibacillus sp. B_LB10_24]|uniref:ABC transporter ATP-binding protein n=1 Tax=Brevibacillus sp. B_LB10_24 TaxID=3380645 RepID=UPI0038BAABCC
MTNCMVELKQITKQYDQNTVVEQLSLEIQQGEFMTLLGPSGCGKTTTLRMIAGFEPPTSGEILLDGEIVQHRPAYQRNLNTVFQNYALFPHLTTFENVAFGLRLKKIAKGEIEKRVRDALKLVQLEEFSGRKPDQLSGGQKQRVAIARALVNNPKVLLLDEPLGALDLKLRKQMQVELKHLQQQLGITFIFVTHDQEEALTMSDRIAVMNSGKLEQVGTPTDVYDRPVSRFVAEFIGETNLLTGTVKEVGQSRLVIESDGRSLIAPAGIAVRKLQDVTVAIRPEKALLSLKPPAAADSGVNQLPVKLVERIYTGVTTKTVVATPSGKQLVAHEKTDQLLPVSAGDDLFVTWNPAHSVVLTA